VPVLRLEIGFQLPGLVRELMDDFEQLRLRRSQLSTTSRWADSSRGGLAARRDVRAQLLGRLVELGVPLAGLVSAFVA